MAERVCLDLKFEFDGLNVPADERLHYESGETDHGRLAVAPAPLFGGPI
jgi:hypothetical protein